MKVTLAKSAGFCFGVKRAVDTVYEQLEKSVSGNQPIYTFGPIIHNEEVVHDLEEKGVTVLESVEELEERAPQGGTVIIRAHGVEKGISGKIKELGYTLVDATCPFVLKIHRLVEKYSTDGAQIVIIGNEKHPEVKGIKSWSLDPHTAVISTPEEAEKYQAESGKKVCIVAQTTFNYNKFQELVEIINKKGYDIIVLNTICNATEERQTEAAKIARDVDAMIVIGGRNSSNTQKLFEICKNECNNTYYIQTVKDLDVTCFESIDNVGITAGASTPNKIIEEVQKNVRNEL
ncbi:4-hydroxy-3-methylbut-2-enyl diphosphate reductase [Roseburia rectibacter]|uniref:4-hydroxy-3-methylbut-2-enyl diphosphate reductase n=1 Tax=Roseburia rectibacter TaxID=2763062 RepID=UPI00164C033E|nr:4-hydroxy-3-methylbut-2-enyl diphosphate reductase [Roseburia rectibacter]UMY98583.1 4-hydroxy-3-methylbut-2-enyl diphosphate reductase [Roseburia rectibacter]